MVVEIRLFGVLKKFGQAGMLILDIPDSCSVAELRNLITQVLLVRFPSEFHSILVDRAALADESEVLGESEILVRSRTLALLPPVCGG